MKRFLTVLLLFLLLLSFSGCERMNIKVEEPQSEQILRIFSFAKQAEIAPAIHAYEHHFRM